MGVQTSIEVWVAHVKLLAPFSDPDITCNQNAEEALRLYKVEEASTI
jgi:hypothetical protein